MDVGVTIRLGGLLRLFGDISVTISYESRDAVAIGYWASMRFHALNHTQPNQLIHQPLDLTNAQLCGSGNPTARQLKIAFLSRMPKTNHEDSNL